MSSAPQNILKDEMCLLQQTCGIKNKISREDWPEPFLTLQDHCQLKVPGTDYPEHIKASPDRTRTQQAYIGMLERRTVGSRGGDQDFTVWFM